MCERVIHLTLSVNNISECNKYYCSANIHDLYMTHLTKKEACFALW